MDGPELSLSQDSLLEHATWLRQLALELVRDPGAADDLVQETWLAFLKARPDTQRPLRPWLARVARNAAALRLRKRSGRAAREEEVARPEGVPSAHELVERAEEQRRLVDAVLGLGEPYRSTLLLRFYEGMTPAQIARAQDVPAATVRTRLHRGLEQVRRRLDEEHGGDRRAWMLILQPLLHEPASTVGVGAALLAAAATVALVVSVLGVGWGGRAQAPASLDAPAGAGESAEGTLATAVGVPPGREALEGDGVAAGPSSLRALRLVNQRDGRPLADYAVLVKDRELRTDDSGRVLVPAQAAELVPLDDGRQAVEELELHGQRRTRPLRRSPVSIPAVEDGDELILATGPTYRLALSAAASLELEALSARLSSTRPDDYADDGRPRQVASVRSATRDPLHAWVRFGAVPEGVERSDLAWNLEVRDEQGLWWGSTSVAPDGTREQAPRAITLESTAVVTGRLLGVPPQVAADVTVALISGGDVERVVAFTAPDEEGGFRLRWILPGSYRLSVVGALEEPLTRTLELHPGERRVLDVEVAALPSAGPLAGRVVSESGVYEGQLLLFLRDEGGAVTDVFPTTWRRDEDQRLVAPFRFEDAPAGALQLDVVSLADAVTCSSSHELLTAPSEGIVLTLQDQRPACDWAFQVRDDGTGELLEEFEVEVRLDGGPPRSYRRGRAEGQPGSWTLLAGGMRWNRFEGPAPLRSLPAEAGLEWTVRAEGYREVQGNAASFDVLAPGRRGVSLLLAPR